MKIPNYSPPKWGVVFSSTLNNSARGHRNRLKFGGGGGPYDLYKLTEFQLDRTKTEFMGIFRKFRKPPSTPIVGLRRFWPSAGLRYGPYRGDTVASHVWRPNGDR
jgi:hypothetical protein